MAVTRIPPEVGNESKYRNVRDTHTIQLAFACRETRGVVKVTEPKGGWNMQSRRFSGLPLIGVFAIIYVIAGKIGLNLASLHASAIRLAPQESALAAILVLGIERGRRFLLCVPGKLTTAGDVATSVAIASGNTLEAIAARGW